MLVFLFLTYFTLWQPPGPSRLYKGPNIIAFYGGVIFHCIYVESRKMVQITYLQGRNRDEDIEDKQVDTVGVGVGWSGRLGLMYMQNHS